MPKPTETEQVIETQTEESELETTDETQEESSEETSTEESTESKEETKKESTEDDFADFKEFAKANDLPDDIDSPEKIVEAVKNIAELRREVIRLSKERGDTKEPPPKKEEERQLFSPSPFTSHFKKLAESGVFKTAEGDQSAFYHSLGRMLDEVMGPELKNAADGMYGLFGQLMSVQKTLADMEWKSLPDYIRSKVKRSDIERVAKDHKLNLEESAKFFAMTERPELMNLFLERKDKPPDKKKSNFRWNQAKGGRQSDYFGANEWQKYIKPDGSVDEVALNKMKDQKKADKILDQIMAHSKNVA